MLATTFGCRSKVAFDVAGNIRFVGGIFHARKAQRLVTNVRFGLYMAAIDLRLVNRVAEKR